MRRHCRWLAAGIILVLLGATGGYLSRLQVRKADEGYGPSLGSSRHVLLAYNDLGMHCLQPDYAAFFIFPPANNLRAQVFDRTTGKLINAGITIDYAIQGNTSSADKVNFWWFSGSYGYWLPPNIGLRGLGLAGRMTLDGSRLFWRADAIPVVPYLDTPSPVEPYQLADLTLRDADTGTVLTSLKNVVLPVSDEMNCQLCHGSSDTWTKILASHDKRAGTALNVDLKRGVRHRCNECHADPALDAPGKPGLPQLSEAIHGSHASRMPMSKLDPSCYNCHPGTTTRCNRGAMAKAGRKCDSPGCHGSMTLVAESIAAGRVPWRDEPKCSSPQCHEARFAQNAGKAYKDSYLVNAPAPEMNGVILCGTCHNGPHAEWPSTEARDNLVPTEVQGDSEYIHKCPVCHPFGDGRVHS